MFPFGVKTSRLSSPFVILDKSFLEGVSVPQLLYYAQQRWIFGVTETLMFELLRKDDPKRIPNLLKLHKVEDNLMILPGIGEMFRAEGESREPAATVLVAKRVRLIVEKGPSGEYFELAGDTLTATEERSADWNARLPLVLDAWNGLRSMPDLRDVRQGQERHAIVRELELKVGDDREDIRGFYRNHWQPPLPPPELIGEDWATFRWIQVQLLAGLDYIERHGEQTNPNREKVLHDLLDLDYLVAALLVGGLACRDRKIVERFRFLRRGGIVLR